MAIDEKLRAVISRVESSGNPHALRFEPGVYERATAGAFASAVAACQATHHCSHATACALVSFSYGLFQVMGFNVYSGAHRGVTVDALLTDAALQNGLFDDFLHARGLDAITYDGMVNSPDIRRRFIAAYNGPGAVDAYWAAMQREALHI